ncbi:MAG: hypothetical protein PVG03_14260 [Desulfarculaceae bacterium]|jgi:hypothetical protein
MPNPEINPDMKIVDVIYQHRDTLAVFKRYESITGQCICCQDLFQTIGQICSKYDLDPQAFLLELKEAAGVPNQEES